MALNTTLTPELLLEGKARNLLRHVQSARKKAQLEVSDHINLGLEVSRDLKAALKSQEESIKAEGLVSSLRYGVISDAEYADTASVDGVDVTITIRRAQSADDEQ